MTIKVCSLVTTSIIGVGMPMICNTKYTMNIISHTLWICLPYIHSAKGLQSLVSCDYYSIIGVCMPMII